LTRQENLSVLIASAAKSLKLFGASKHFADLLGTEAPLVHKRILQENRTCRTWVYWDPGTFPSYCFVKLIQT